MIPERMADLGLKSDVFVAYAYGSYLCLSVDVQSADARRIIEKKAGKEKLQEYENFLGIFGMPQLNNSIDDTVASIIGQKLQVSLPIAMREKMKDRMGLDMRIIACSEGEQAAFLIGTLKELKEKKQEAA